MTSVGPNMSTTVASSMATAIAQRSIEYAILAVFPSGRDDVTVVEVTAMPDTIDNVAERLARLENTVAEGFHGVTNQFAAVDGRFDALEKRVGSLESTVSQGFRRIENADLAQGRRTDTLERKIDTVDRKIDTVAEDLRADINELTDAVNSLARNLRRNS